MRRLLHSSQDAKKRKLYDRPPLDLIYPLETTKTQAYELKKVFAVYPSVWKKLTQCTSHYWPYG